MKITRMSGLLALVAVGALTLSACGSDNNTRQPHRPRRPLRLPQRRRLVRRRRQRVRQHPAAAAAGGDTTFEGAGFACAEGDLRSSGSTAQGKVMEQWIADFNALCGANINAYGGGGSGKGIQDFIANQVDFAGSDSALNADQAAQRQSTSVREQRRAATCRW